MIVELIPRIAAEEAAEERRAGKWRPRCSSAGTERCARAEVYKALGEKPKPLPGRTVLIFEDGDWHEELSLDKVRKTVFQVHSEQMAVNPVVVAGSHPGYKCSVCEQQVEEDVVHGHIDAMVTDPLGEDLLLEHKSASMYAFERWANGSEVPWDYVTQSALYVYGLSREGSNVRRAIILIKNKNNANYLELVIACPTVLGDNEPDTVVESATYTEGETTRPVLYAPGEARRAGLITAAVKRFEEVVQHRDRKELPSRPFSWGHWRCSYCPFGETCWDGYTEEAQQVLKALAGEALTEPEDAALMRELHDANKEAATAKKKADALKERAKVRLNSLGIRNATVSDGNVDYDVKLDMRTRETLDASKVPDEVKQYATRTSTFEVLTVRPKKKGKR